MWENEFQKVISDYFRKAKLKNSRFSQRALAKKMSVSSSTLSDLLNGRRHVSAQKALKILARLTDLDGGVKTNLEARIGLASARRVQLNKDSYDLISEWIYLGILCLLELEDAPKSPSEIALALGMNEGVVKKAVSRLTQLGMLVAKPGGGFSIENAYFETSDDVADEQIVASHLNGLDKAREALLSEPTSRRDFISLTVAGDVGKLAAGKKLTRRFISQLSRTLTGAKLNEVYRISVQIYPLTKRKT